MIGQDSGAKTAILEKFCRTATGRSVFFKVERGVFTTRKIKTNAAPRFRKLKKFLKIFVAEKIVGALISHSHEFPSLFLLLEMVHLLI